MNQELHFVTGKGGVGKSLIAAALARKQAQKGRKTLLVELGERSFYKDFFELTDVGFQPQKIGENLDLARWSGPESLQDYALHLIRVESLVKLFFENSVSRTLIEVAPALSELAVLGKATSGLRKHGPQMPYDSIVIDAYATGHFLALFRAPIGIAEVVRIGPMSDQSREISRALRDSNSTKIHVVTLPEEMPVQETIELVESLKTEFQLSPEIIVNKWIDLPEGPLSEGVSSNFEEFLVTTRERQAEAFKKLSQLKAPIQKTPLILDENPAAVSKKIAEAMP